MADPLYVRSLQDFYSLAALYAREGRNVDDGQSTFSAFAFDDGAFGSPSASAAYNDTHTQVMAGLANLSAALQGFSQAVKTAGQRYYDTDAAIAGAMTQPPPPH